MGRLQYYQLQQAGGFGEIGHAYALGSFGRGQPDPYNRLLTVDAAGNVTVGDGGIPGQVDSTRVFTFDSPGVYTAEPGDAGTLADTGGVYTLTEADGSLTAFNANGTVNYFQDAHGNRTTATESAVPYTSSVLVVNADGVESGTTTTGTANLITKLTAADGDTVELGYDAYGLATSLTDPEGRVTTYSYDTATGDLIAVAGPAGTTTYAYYPNNSHAVQSVTSPAGVVTTYTYDGQGRLLTASSTGGADPITYAYDAQGNATTTTATGQTSETFRGEDGSVVAVENASGAKEAFTYDAASDLTAVTGLDGTESTVAYGANGLEASTTDPAGGTESTTYTAAGLPATQTDADGNTTKLTYDAAGDVLTNTDPAGAAQAYTYSPAGQLLTAATAAGRHVTDTYDAAGLLVSQAFSDGSTAAYTYDAHRNLLTATSAAGTESFTYDAADRLTSVTYPNGTSLTYAYDAGGQLTTKTDQTGYATHYAYDPAGQLLSMIDGTGALVAAYAYDAAGNVSRVDLGNGTATTYAYDAEGDTTSVTNLGPTGAVLSSFAYTYDANGRVTAMVTTAGTTNYTYDVLGQLTGAALPGGRTITYAYDAEGNRTTVTDSGTPATYTTNDLNQYTSAGATTYAYDADGNLTTSTTSAGTATYAYDVQDRLASMTGPAGTTTYTYDALGNRIATTVNGVTTDDLVDPSAAGDLAGQFTTAGAAVDHYTYGLGLTSQTGAAGTDFYAFDAQGNTADLTGASGAVVNAYSYLPFGQTLTATGTAPNPFTFDGRAGVTAAGGSLYLTRTRLYDAATGRFTKRDSMGLAGGTTNLYKYADNDPVNESDPTGNFVSAGEQLFIQIFGRIPFFSAADAATVSSLNFSIAAGADAAAAGTAPALLTTFGQNALSDEAATFFYSGLSGAAGGSAAPGLVTVGAPALGSALATDAAGTAVLTNTGSFTFTLASGGASGGVATTAGAFTLGSLAAAGAGVIGAVAAGHAINQEYNRENPNGTPIADQEVINQATYNQILRRPALAAFLKDLREIQGSDLTPDQITQAIQQYAHANAYPALYNPDPAPAKTQGVGSEDPNSITGPSGYGPDGFILPTASLPYQINFTNAATATAPAQVVTVTQTLDANLDLSTFQLGAIGFGSTTVAVPAGLQTFTTTVSLGSTLSVIITADLDAATRVVTWTFTSIDPTTGDAPSDPLAGFLPPDATDPQGSGFVDYTVRPVAGLASGATVAAQASIVFDANPAIATPVVTNTVDAGDPTSTVAALPATQGRLSFPVSWSGTDDAGGSGVASYTVLVSVDGAAYTVWQNATTATSAVYAGSPGHTYAFVCQAADNVGHNAAFPAAAQATTAVPAIARTLTVSKGHPARFTDAAGGVVVVALTGPGSGVLSFLTTGNGDPVEFALTDTTAATRVSVRAAGKPGTLTLGDVSAAGSLAAFTAPTADLVGSFAVAGTLGSLSLDDATAGPATVTVGGPGVATAFRFGALHDVSLTTAAPVRSLVAAAWTDGATDALSAPSIAALAVAGSFDAAVTLTAAGVDVRSAAVRGSVTGGTWTLAGSAARVSVGGDDAGSLTAASVGSLRVGGNLSGATLTLTGAKGTDLAALAVTGSVTGSTITAAAGVGAVTVGGMTGSTLYAGVAAGTTGLPTAAADLAAGGSVRSFTDRGRSPFAGSDVAASAIGAVTLADVTTDDAGAVFGVAAHTIGTFALDQPKAKPVRYPAKALKATLTTLGGDLRVEVL